MFEGLQCMAKFALCRDIDWWGGGLTPPIYIYIKYSCISSNSSLELYDGYKIDTLLTHKCII